MDFFDNLKHLFTEKKKLNSIKKFSEILQEKRTEELELTEIPFSIQILRSFYLKGKLAKICGNYKKSLEFLYKSRETLVISDAFLIRKSNKKIFEIYEILKEKFQEDKEFLENEDQEKLLSEENNLIKNTKINARERIKKISELRILYENRKKRIFKLHNYLIDIDNKKKDLLKELESYKENLKDVLILLDVSNVQEKEIKKYENLIKLIQGFFEDYICNGDRFGLCLFQDSLRNVIPFEKKANSNKNFIKEKFANAMKYLVNIFRDSDFANREEFDVNEIVLKGFEYLNNKWDTSNEKWILLFLAKFPKCSEIKDKKLKDFFKEYINLVVIGFDFELDDRINARIFLRDFTPKSTFLDYCDISDLGNLFRKKVFKEEDIYFPFEIYRSGKM